MPILFPSLRSRVKILREFIVAAALAVVFALAGKRVALLTGAMSEPREDRWHQCGPIPRLGGPAILLAISPFVEFQTIIGLACFCIVGLIDDYRAMRPAIKAAVLLVPCAISGWLLGNVWIGVACWVAANAVNMLDHADGVASATCVGSLFVASGPLGLAGAGASFGFLLHNWPPARMFLGDSGSLMLGALLVFAWAPHGALAMLSGLFVPLCDASFVVIRRLKRRSAPWIGGTDHTAHSMLRLGVAPRLLPVMYGAVAAILALLGIELS